MPPYRVDTSEVQPIIGRTYIDDDTAMFLSDGEVRFVLPNGTAISMPFKGAKSSAEAVAQAATALDIAATNFTKLARRLLQA